MGTLGGVGVQAGDTILVGDAVNGASRSHIQSQSGVNTTHEFEFTDLPARGVINGVHIIPSVGMVAASVGETTAATGVFIRLGYATVAVINSEEEREYDLVASGQLANDTLRGSLFVAVTTSELADVTCRLDIGPK